MFAIKKVISGLLSVTLTVLIMISLCTVALSASYNSIKLNVPRVSQRPNTGDCAIASIASVEAYFNGMPGGDYNSDAYKYVYAKNGYSISAKWGTLGYNRICSFSMDTVYSTLRSGIPVIVYRTSCHYSVIYGYNGNTSKLEMSGFLIFDVDDSYTNSTAYKTLDKWVGGYSVNEMVIRKSGESTTVKDLSIQSNHPNAVHKYGQTYSINGCVSSNYNITKVVATIKDSAGKIAQNSTYTAVPNSKYFSLTNCDENMHFSLLPNGKYVYSVYAEDAGGRKKTYSFAFEVEGQIEVNVPVQDSPLYTITALTFTGLRISASTSAKTISSIPSGTTLSVYEESGDWARTYYNGSFGWIALKYFGKDTLFHIRTTSVYSLKSSYSTSSSTVINIPKNTVLSTSLSVGDWLKVKYNDKWGWINTSACIINIGDVTGNSIVESADALYILQYAIGSATMTSAQKKVADANGDGIINSVDALIVLQIATGII